MPAAAARFALYLRCRTQEQHWLCEPCAAVALKNEKMAWHYRTEKTFSLPYIAEDKCASQKRPPKRASQDSHEHLADASFLFKKTRTRLLKHFAAEWFTFECRRNDTQHSGMHTFKDPMLNYACTTPSDRNEITTHGWSGHVYDVRRKQIRMLMCWYVCGGLSCFPGDHAQSFFHACSFKLALRLAAASALAPSRADSGAPRPLAKIWQDLRQTLPAFWEISWNLQN